MPDAPPSLDEMIAAVRWARGQVLAGDKFAAPLDAALAQLEASRWRDIAVAPKDDSRVDVWQTVTQRGELLYEQRVPNAIWDQDQWVSDDTGEILNKREPGHYGRIFALTHFMPIPAPPSTAREAG